MELDRAQQVAKVVSLRLAPLCRRIEVAGSVRRRKPFPKDIDFLLIPSQDLWGLNQAIRRLGVVAAGGDKLMRVLYGNIQLDFYFASEETWATLLLIRTGSAENNIRLCSAAKRKGWHLAANGDGLFNEKGERVAGDSERSIYEALSLPWQAPEERG